MSSEKFETVKLEKSGKFLNFLYNSPKGRALLRVCSSKWISKAVALFLDTRFSNILIERFAKKNDICFEDYLLDNVNSFNGFFSRKIKPDRRPIDSDPTAIVAPCDGLVSVYKITDDTVFPVKQSAYTVSSLLKNDDLAKSFNGAYAYVFRLGVNNYHRYCYPANGVKGENSHIDGVLHTVRPVALYSRPVFCENSREYTVISSEEFGDILQMEVGAMLVGKICNYHGCARVVKGQEKGKFLYGGSTVILLSFAEPYEELIKNTENSLETKIKMGERINKPSK